MFIGDVNTTIESMEVVRIDDGESYCYSVSDEMIGHAHRCEEAGPVVVRIRQPKRGYGDIRLCSKCYANLWYIHNNPWIGSCMTCDETLARGKYRNQVREAMNDHLYRYMHTNNNVSARLKNDKTGEGYAIWGRLTFWSEYL